MENITAGVPVTLAPGIVRMTAPNPGVMTGPGTNTYIIGERELAVIDPGPDIEAHVAALRELVGDRLTWILCTHTHLDHSPGAAQLAKLTGARVAGRIAEQDGRQDAAFAPERVLKHGESIEVEGVTLRAVHTPGHASNHLCYLFEEKKLLFTGDHVMQGSTVVISPPDGDMQAYLTSLANLLELELTALAPGHGRIIDAPHDEVRRLIAHRLKREQKVVAALARSSPGTLDELVQSAYDDVSEKLHPVARRSLHAHLIKLAREGKASENAGAWRAV